MKILHKNVYPYRRHFLMDLFAKDKTKHKKGDAYYYDDHNNFLKVPSMLGSKDDILKFASVCMKGGGVTVDDLTEVWDDSLKNNERIINILNQLYVEYSTSGTAGRWKALAYNKALLVIRKLKVPIVSGKQAAKLKGIGKGISAKIDEILATGGLEKLKEFEPPVDVMSSPDLRVNKEDVLANFMKVWGVGPVMAANWYKAGYRRIEDVPKKDLTAGQTTYIKYMDELQLPIPREEIEAVEERVVKLIGRNVESIDMVGSYRRGASESGDIDILITDSSDWTLYTTVDALKDDGIIVAELSSGAHRFSGIAITPGSKIHRRIDIFLVDKSERGPALLHFTGPADFVIDINNRAIAQNYKFSEKGLFRGDEAEYTPTEASVFEILGMEYVAPRDRF